MQGQWDASMTSGTNKESTGSEPRHIPLDEVLDISSVAEFRATLLDVLASRLPIVLDAAVVERVDTAALQVLTAFIQDARGQGLQVRWGSPSQALVHSAGLLGLVEVLGLEEAA